MSRGWTKVHLVVLAAALVGGGLCWADTPAAEESPSKPPQPRPFLSVGAAEGLTATVGAPVEFSAALPTREALTQANVAQLFVRTYHVQKSLLPIETAQTGYTFREPGYALVVLSAGPSSERDAGDAWQRTPYCSKVILRVKGEEGKEPALPLSDPGLCGKIGQRIELVPYISPAGLRVGDDFAVRAYFNSSGQTGVEVRAYAPDGTVTAATTVRPGTAVFRITQAGQWVFRYTKAHEGQTYTAELVFTVPPGVREVPPEPQEATLFVPRDGTELDAWTELGPAPITSGPWTGRCTAMVAQGQQAGHWLVAGASGGVWRTTDSGATWEPLTDHLPSAAIGALAVDPNNGNVVYAGTGEANFANHCLYGLGVYKTTDFGTTWTQLAESTFGGRTFSKMAVSQGDSSVIFAAISHAGGFYPLRNAAKNHPGADGPVGVFRSTDGGVTWDHLTDGVPAKPASDIAIDPANANIIFAAIGDVFGDDDNGIYKSTDGGATWTRLISGLPLANVGRISLAVAPSDSRRLYTIYTYPSDESGGGASLRNVYRSVDGGDSWIPMNPGNFQATYGWYLSIVTVHPTDPDIAFVGGVELLRTINGGTNWSVVTPQHVDMHGLSWDGTTLLSADDGGVHYTANNGSTWYPANDGLGVTQFYAGISLNSSQESWVLGGLQDNGTCRRVSGLEWAQGIGGDGGWTANHPNNPNTVLGQYQGAGNVYRSVNGGVSFSYAGTGISPSDRTAFYSPIVFDPGTHYRAVCATHRIYQSFNQGSSWSSISTDLTNGSPAAVRTLTFAPSDRMTMWAVTNDGLVKLSRDSGYHWSTVRENVVGWPRVTRELAVDPIDPGVAYLVVQHFGEDQVWKATEYGDTWTAIDGDLPDLPVNGVAVYRSGTLPILLVGTDNDVYVSYTDGAHWRPLDGSLPNSPVIDLVCDGALQRVVIATLGRGAWQMPLPVLGDVERDGDLDLADYAALQNCCSRAHDDPDFVAPSELCQERFDRAFDTDVDIDDFAIFQERLVGPAS